MNSKTSKRGTAINQSIDQSVDQFRFGGLSLICSSTTAGKVGRQWNASVSASMPNAVGTICGGRVTHGGRRGRIRRFGRLEASSSTIYYINVIPSERAIGMPIYAGNSKG